MSASVLEIGAGTGASTVVLAEVAKRVYAIDLDPHCLQVARDRVLPSSIDERGD